MSVRIKRVPQVLSGHNFPATDPEDGTYFVFNVDQSSFTSGKTVRNDADDANVTSASEGDLFKYFSTGTKWVRQYQAVEASQLDAVIHVAEADEDDAGTISPAQLEEFLDWHLYDRSVYRLVVTENNPIYSGNHMSVSSVSGNTYRVKINAAGFTSNYAAIDEEILAGVSIGQKIRLYSAANSIHWEGEVSGKAEQNEAGVYTFEVSFPSRTGTIAIGNVLSVSLGYATSGQHDQIANSELRLLWRYRTDYSEGVGSSDTNRNLISGESFDAHALLLFWIEIADSGSEGFFAFAPTELWKDVSDGIGSDSEGELTIYVRDNYILFRYIDNDTFRITTSNSPRLRAIFGMRGL